MRISFIIILTLISWNSFSYCKNIKKYFETVIELNSEIKTKNLVFFRKFSKSCKNPKVKMCANILNQHREEINLYQNTTLGSQFVKDCQKDKRLLNKKFHEVFTRIDVKEKKKNCLESLKAIDYCQSQKSKLDQCFYSYKKSEVFLFFICRAG